MNMGRVLFFFLGAITGAGFAWAILQAPSPRPPAAGATAEATDPTPNADSNPGMDSKDRALADLYDALAEATEARVQLEHKLAETREELDFALDADSRAFAEEARRAGAPQKKTSKRGKKDFGLDPDRLVEFGIPRSDVAWLRERYERFEMDRLQLHNTASREKWFRTGRFASEDRALRQEFRSDVGEDVYDFLLYNAGQTNRSVVGEVMQESPAAAAGVQPGDVIVAYDETRVYTPGEIRYQTTQGEAGRLVAVDVIRGGQTVRVYVPRGPLGVYLEPASEIP